MWYLERMRALILPCALALILAACSTDFQPYEGRDAVREGHGGTRQVVDGMDWWTSGEPPRHYRVLGTIMDNRGSGIIAKVTFESNIVKMARQAGGDAVIEITNPGFPGATDFNRRTAKFFVIKYVD
jgi:hypothetical protein